MIYTLSKKIKKRWPQKTRLVSPIISPGSGAIGHGLRQFWCQSVLPVRILADKVKILYSTVQEGILYPPVSQVVTIHDILPTKHAKFYPTLKYYQRYVVSKVLRSCKAVICVSESTRQDLIDNFSLKGIPVHVVYEGVDKKKYYPRNGKIIREKYGLNDFILYVGDTRPHKNLRRAYEAFSRIRSEGMKFVCAGPKVSRFFPHVEKRVRELKLEKRVLFLDYVPDEDLPHLYSEAKALVFPSLHEGFGLPPLEAMASGTPVVVSNTSSLPEICGDAACYVDPYDTESIAEGICKVLDNRDFRDHLIAKGLERVKAFSWERSANKILDILKGVSLA